MKGYGRSIYIHNGILLSHKKNEILSFARAWMDLDFCKISQTEKRHLYVESKYKTKQKQAHRYTEQTSCLKGETDQRRKEVMQETKMYKLLGIKEISSRIYNTGNISNAL